MSNGSGSRRGWLWDLTEGILPDDGLCIGTSGTVPGGQQGWGDPWKVNGSLRSQKVVENYGNMICSPSGRRLRWRLHEVGSKYLFCHPSQPCHGDVIVKAFAEAMAEEKGPRSLRSVMGVEEPSLFVASRGGLDMQEMMKGCSTFSREKEFRNLLPFPLSPEPTKAEKELSTTARELMHQAAVDVWMFLLIWLSNGSLKAVRSKARKTHRRRFFKQHQRHSKQPSGS